MRPDILEVLVSFQDEIDAIIKEKGTDTSELALLARVKDAFTDIRSEIAEGRATIQRLTPADETKKG